jgi:hypothetical protein
MAIEVNVVNYLDSSSAAAFAAARDTLIRVGLKVYREKRGKCLYIRVESIVDKSDPRWKEFCEPYKHRQLVQNAFGVGCVVTSAAFGDRITVKYRLSPYTPRQLELDF